MKKERKTFLLIIFIVLFSFFLLGCAVEEKIPDEIPGAKKEVPQIQQEFPKP